MIVQPNYDNLSDEVFCAIVKHYDRWTLENASEDIYAYVIYTPGLVSSIAISVLTEQGLAQVANEYKTKHGYKESLEQLKTDLRWSVADTPHCGDYETLFSPLNERLCTMLDYVDDLDEDDPGFDEHIDNLYAILVDALNRFRAKKLGGEARPLLYVDFGDMSDEERLSFVQKCNDEESVEWYDKSIRMAR